MSDSSAEIEIKVNGETVLHSDTEYIADSCFINGNDSWKVYCHAVSGQIEITVTPSIEPPTIYERVKLFVWNILYDVRYKFKKVGDV